MALTLPRGSPSGRHTAVCQDWTKRMKISRTKRSLSVSLTRHTQSSRTSDYCQSRGNRSRRSSIWSNNMSKGKSTSQSSAGTFGATINNLVNPSTIPRCPTWDCEDLQLLLWQMHKQEHQRPNHWGPDQQRHSENPSPAKIIITCNHHHHMPGGRSSKETMVGNTERTQHRGTDDQARYITSSILIAL